LADNLEAENLASIERCEKTIHLASATFSFSSHTRSAGDANRDITVNSKGEEPEMELQTTKEHYLSNVCQAEICST
jgi:hypothetical protein